MSIAIPHSTDGYHRAYHSATTAALASTLLDTSGRKRIAASPFVWTDPSLIPRRQTLYAGHFNRGFMGLTLGVGGGGKSNQEIVDMLAMGSGLDLLGHQPEEKLKVWYINLEDPAEEIQRRLAAAVLHHGIEPRLIEDSIFIDSGRDQDFVVMKSTGKGTQVVEPVVSDIIREIIDNEIDVLIVDPFISTHEVEENDNTKIQMVAAQWVRIAHEADCAVELVHHVNKSAGDGKAEVTADSGRGAGALKDKARSVRVINGMSSTEATQAGIDQRDRFDYFKLGNGKSNMARRTGHVEWRRMVSVPLRNGGMGVMADFGDEVGVVEAWRWPSSAFAMEGVPETALNSVKAIIGAGNYRANIQAKDWAGRVIANVLQLDVDIPADKQRCKTILAQWIKDGNFEEVTRPDENRVDRPFLMPVD